MSVLASQESLLTVHDNYSVFYCFSERRFAVGDKEVAEVPVEIRSNAK